MQRSHVSCTVTLLGIICSILGFPHLFLCLQGVYCVLGHWRMSVRQKELPEILLTRVQMVCAVWEVSSRILCEPEGRAGVRFLLSFPAACNSLISDITSSSLAHQLNHALISIPPVRGFLPLLSFLSRQRSIARSCHLNTQPLKLPPICLWCQ